MARFRFHSARGIVRIDGTALAAIAMGLVMFLGSLLFVADIVEGEQSLNWPKSTGAVMAHVVSRGCTSRTRTSYEALPAYRYDVAGRNYTSRRITTTNRFCFNDEAMARDFLQQNYPVGAKVEVSYDPAHPDQAVLRPGEYSKFTYGIVAAAWLVTLILWIAAWWRMPRASIPAASTSRTTNGRSPAALRKTIRFSIRLGGDKPRASGHEPGSD